MITEAGKGHGVEVQEEWLNLLGQGPVNFEIVTTI